MQRFIQRRIDARVELSGVGSAAAPIAAVYPQEVVVAEQPLGTQGTQALQLKNVGGKDLVLTKLELTGLNPGDFALVNGSSGSNVRARSTRPSRPARPVR